MQVVVIHFESLYHLGEGKEVVLTGVVERTWPASTKPLTAAAGPAWGRAVATHTGAAPGGSQWTALHPPTEILSIQIHETVEQAFACEAALWNLWAGNLKNHSRVRGGRYNSVMPLKYPPRGWQLENPPQ